MQFIQSGKDDLLRVLIFVKSYYMANGGHFLSIPEARQGRETSSQEENRKKALGRAS